MVDNKYNIAIIGSGPSGLYLAEILALKIPDITIDIYERLSRPFGLIVAGVAPDHLHTRRITEQFKRTLNRSNVRLACNTEIGKDLHYSELKQNYRWIVIATGAAEDRILGIPGENSAGIYGSGVFSRWYNNDEKMHSFTPYLGKKIAIIGNGNVALDIARMLAKTPKEHDTSDLTEKVRNHLADNRPTDIYIIGRSSPVQASFTLPELSELGELEQASPTTDSQYLINLDAERLPISQQKLLLQLENYANRQVSNTHTRINFIFNTSPTEFLTNKQGQVSAVTLHNNLKLDHNSTYKLQIDTAITAIGYHSRPIDSIPFDSQKGVFLNTEGEIEPQVYCLGWCQRGPQGVIPANRADAMKLAKKIISQYKG